MKASGKSGGFTLIELLAALTVAAIVAVVGALALRTGLDFQRRAQSELGLGESLRAADRMLSREWSRRRDQGVLTMTGLLEFQSDRMYARNAEGAVRIRYVCEEDDAGRMKLARQLLGPAEERSAVGETKQQAGATPGKWRVIRSDDLITRLADCNFRYLRTRDTREGRFAQWIAGVEPGQPAPRLVRLRLVTESGEIAPLVYGVDG